MRASLAVLIGASVLAVPGGVGARTSRRLPAGQSVRRRRSFSHFRNKAEHCTERGSTRTDSRWRHADGFGVIRQANQERIGTDTREDSDDLRRI